ncbi:DUF721 domain-containing protein [Primorskyibacter sp. S187A]|uniref:DUF721 domain-containing protein n=1 Tax=Primorskyibacter sp. S187A TaxID=3415130 RepID=UPI003C7E6AF1
MAKRPSTTKGFKRTASVLSSRIRKAGESRGFAVTRLLTHWDEIAGLDVSQISRPVEVSYGRGGMGATLSLLTTGAQAPMLEMQKEQIRSRVNACYGYNAIARVRITQTAPTGFADGQVAFQHKEAPKGPPAPPAEAVAQAEREMVGVSDPGLRDALTRLGSHVLSKTKPPLSE